MAKRRIVGRSHEAICKDITDLILDYLTEQLDPKTVRAYEKHLRICPDCVAFLRTYKKTMELTRQFLKGKFKKTRSRPGSVRIRPTQQRP